MFDSSDRTWIIRRTFITTFSLVLIAVGAVAGLAQNSCFTTEEAKRVTDSLKTPSYAEDKKVRKELLQMRDESMSLYEKIYHDVEKNRSRIPEENQLSEMHLLRLCQLIKENGWLYIKENCWLPM